MIMEESPSTAKICHNSDVVEVKKKKITEPDLSKMIFNVTKNSELHSLNIGVNISKKSNHWTRFKQDDFQCDK